jgi:hypothetical protein
MLSNWGLIRALQTNDRPARPAPALQEIGWVATAAFRIWHGEDEA